MISNSLSSQIEVGRKYTQKAVWEKGGWSSLLNNPPPPARLVSFLPRGFNKTFPFHHPPGILTGGSITAKPLTCPIPSQRPNIS